MPKSGPQSNEVNGECLCGAVSWRATGPYQFLGMCQCSLCRKVTGSAFATNLFVASDQFNWLSGEDHRLVYLMPSPKKFGNASCKTCGSRVPKLNSAGDRVLIPLGSTDEAPGIEPAMVCAEDHAAWFSGLETALNG